MIPKTFASNRASASPFGRKPQGRDELPLLADCGFCLAIGQRMLKERERTRP
jgi:hypothetical protein